MRSAHVLRPVAAALLVAILSAAPAAAQGRGRGKGKGDSPHEQIATADPITSSPATPQSRAAYLGSWLDDASVVGPAAVWAAVSFVAAQGGYFSFPIADLVIGATPRSHFGVSIPVSHIDDGAGGTGASVEQAFFYGKWRLRDASQADGRLGVAVAPVLEILRSDVDGSQQVSVGVPVNLEVRHGAMRAYGSVGFFSRGALFQSAALEVVASPRVAITGSIGHTYSIASDPLIVESGRHRTDLGIGASASVTRVGGRPSRGRCEDREIAGAEIGYRQRAGRRTRRLKRGDLGRQPQMPEDPSDHRGLLDERHQAQPPAAARTSQHVQPERALHQRRPLPPAGAGVG